MAGIPLGSTFNMNAALPIDERFTCADLTARDAILAGRRFEGMKVYVTSEMKNYQLVGGTDNSFWVEQAGSTGGDAYQAIDRMSGDGVTVLFTLPTAPGSADNMAIFITGVYQQKNTYTLSGADITFNVAPPSGTDNIEVISWRSFTQSNFDDMLQALADAQAAQAAAEAAAADAADQVVLAQAEVVNAETAASAAQTSADNAAASAIAAQGVPRGTVITSILSTPPTGYISAMNKTIGTSGADYSGGAYFDLYSDIWAMAGTSTTADDPFTIAGGKGADAATDWAAAKLITVNFETNEVFVRAKGSARDLGSYEDDATAAHTHSINCTSAGQFNSFNAGGARGVFDTGALGGGYTNTGDKNTNSTGGTETRPKNVALNYFIKYA